MPVLGFPQAGMMPDPCRRGGARGARKPETRGWRHADRRPGSTQNGDIGARRTETRGHAGRRRGDTRDGDAETRRTETREHARRRPGSTQDGDPGTRKRGDANGSAVGKTAANQEDPLPYFVPEFRPLRTLQTKGPVVFATGPRFNIRCGYSSAATGSSVAAADSHDEQSVHSPAGSAHAAGSTAAGSEAAADSPAGSSVTAWNSASSVWSS